MLQFFGPSHFLPWIGLTHQITVYRRICKRKWKVSSFNAVTIKTPPHYAQLQWVDSQCTFPRGANRVNALMEWYVCYAVAVSSCHSMTETLSKRLCEHCVIDLMTTRRLYESEV